MLEELIRSWDGEEVVVRYDRPTGTWMFVCIHSTARGPAGGGTRMQTYASPAAGLEDAMRVQSFFVMDENFLLHRKRALRLLELMRAHGKAWSLYVFSSANTLRRYSMEEIVGLGISWVWVGLEGKDSAYAKLRGADTRSLVAELQSHGIRVLGSTIVGLPEHRPDNIDDAIEHAVAHDTEFHQFMLYTPLPGTPLYAEHRAQGTLLDEDACPPSDTHGQARFNFRHPFIREGRETEFLLRAFRRDFEANGPSILRIARSGRRCKVGGVATFSILPHPITTIQLEEKPA